MANTDNRFFEIAGHMYKIFPKVTFDSGYEKREFIIEVKGEGRDGKIYTDLIKFEASKSWIAELDRVGIGSDVVVHFTLGGKEWKPADKDEPIYINFLRCWKLDVADNTKQNEPQENAYADAVPDNYDDSNDLPF